MFAAIIAAILNQAQQSVGQFSEADKMYSKEDKVQLEDLQKRSDLDRLGLTEQEMGAIQSSVLGPQQAQQRQRMEEQRAMLASQNMGAAAGAMQQMREDDISDSAAAKAGEFVAQQQLKERQNQLDEMKELKKLREGQNIGKRSAIISGLLGLGETTFGAVSEGQDAAKEATAQSAADALATEQSEEWLESLNNVGATSGGN